MIGIHPKHVLVHVIRPALAKLSNSFSRVDTEAAENLLLGTFAHESKGGRYLHQLGGPAVGIFQMEPRTYSDVRNWLHTRSRYVSLPVALTEYDLMSQALAARCYYYMYPDPLPDAGDVAGLAEYWHKAWCRGCAGTKKEWIEAYQELIVARIKDKV